MSAHSIKYELSEHGRVNYPTTWAHANQAAITDNTTGTVSNTLAAIPNPADAPGTADALRDDLVANILPIIRNIAATLAAHQNAHRSAMVDLGVMKGSA